MAEDENFRKVFVGGLHFNTTEDSLKAFYQQWGDVTHIVVMRDQITQRSRGFGFVTFAASSMLEECLAARPHVIDNKEVECKRAIPREGMQQPLPELHVTSKKLFVGSIKEEMTEDHLREYFSQFGSVASVDITKDRNTGQRRGFGFVTFDDYDPVDKVILWGSHEILGHAIAVKKALEREQKELIAAGGTVRGRGGRGAAPPRGAGPVRGGRGGRGGGPPSGPGYYNGAGYGTPGGYPGGYGGYSDGWNQGAGGWSGPPGGPSGGPWNPSGGYGGGDGYGMSGGNFGSGYGGGYGGGAMKGAGYGQRATGPYGGGFGRGGAAGGGAPGYGGGAPANTQGGWNAKPFSQGGGGYGGGYGQR